MLIDGGGAEDDRFNTAKYVLLPFFDKLGLTRINAVITSHPHADHIMGIINLIGLIQIDRAWYAPWEGLPLLLRDYRDSYRNAGIAEFRVMPPREFPELKIDDNSKSMVLKVSYGTFSILMTGDIGVRAEESLLKYGGALKSTVLKIAHHGSKTSSSEKFLAAVAPELAIVNASRKNIHGHPEPEILRRIAFSGHGVRIFRPSLGGVVSITADDTRYCLTVNGERVDGPAAVK
jgi:competence protein ComEC